LFLSLVFLECALHIFPTLLPMGFWHSIHAVELSGKETLYAPDPILEHRAIPDIFTIEGTEETTHNIRTHSLTEFPDWGWRTDPYDPLKKLNSIILGDSFAYGYGVEQNETTAGLLQNYLTKKNQQILNLGLSNLTGSLQYEIIFDHVIEHYEPKNLIIFHFENEYLDNLFFDCWKTLQNSAFGGIHFPYSRILYRDVIDPRTPPTETKHNKPPVQQISFPSFGSLWAIAQDHSLLKKFIKYKIQNSKIQNSKNYFRNEFCSYVFPNGEKLGPNEPQLQKGYDLDSNAMTRIIRKSKTRGINVIVFMIPLKQVVAWVDDFMSPITRDDALYYYEKIKKVCTDEGAIVIDPLPLWKDVVFTEQLYFEIDGHWTALGHKRAFELLINRI